MIREIVFNEGKTFEMREVDLPPIGLHDVRIRVEFAAPKHGTESHLYSGSVFGNRQWDAELRLFRERTETTLPAIRPVGNMVVGTVTSVGPEVSLYRPGDRVFGYGPIREEHQASETALRPLGNLSEVDAVCADPAHVAFVAVRDGNVRIGDAVAVFGLGAIGLLVTQIARVGGARKVFAVDPSALRREFASGHGADGAFDPTTCDVAVEIKQATDRRGVDVAIETSGAGAALHHAIRCIQQCGTVVHVPWGPKDASALRLDQEFHLNRPHIVGSQAVWQNPDRDHPLWNEERARLAAIELFRAGLITGKGIVTPIVPFDHAVDALKELFTAPDKAIKLGVRLSA